MPTPNEAAAPKPVLLLLDEVLAKKSFLIKAKCSETMRMSWGEHQKTMAGQGNMTEDPHHSRNGHGPVFRWIADGILLAPAVTFSALAIYGMIRNGAYSNVYIPPVSFRVHAFDLLEMSIFFIVTFVMVQPRGPVRNLAISLSLLFLANALYELVYGVHRDWTSLQLTIPLTIASLLLLLFLDKRLHFMVVDKRRTVQFGMGFTFFLASMTLLDISASLAMVGVGQGGLDWVDPLWVASKALSEWMLFPLLNIRSVGAIRSSLPQCQA